MKINLNITELLIYPTRSWLRQAGKLSKERKYSLRRPSMWTMPAGSVQLVQDLDRSNGGIFWSACSPSFSGNFKISSSSKCYYNPNLPQHDFNSSWVWHENDFAYCHHPLFNFISGLLRNLSRIMWLSPPLIHSLGVGRRKSWQRSSSSGGIESSVVWLWTPASSLRTTCRGFYSGGS